METKKYTISMPLRVVVGRKKYTININPYRNWHYHTKNKVKKAYQDLALAKIYKLPKMDKFKLEFKFIKGTNVRTDRDNFCDLHAKFFCDALTVNGIIPDDNDDHLISKSNCSGPIDRKNPRMEITIYDLSSSKVEGSR